MTAQQPELDRLRHGGALVLSMAISRMFPGVQLGDYGVTDGGFYYDFLFPEGNLSEHELAGIEEEMLAIHDQALEIKTNVYSKEEATEFFIKANQPFKRELIEDSRARRFTIASVSDNSFVDILHGKIIRSTRDIGYVKLLSVAGAYWKGDEHRQVLCRVYGINFASADELELFLAYREEAQRRDHRVLGKRLQFFTFDQNIGSGVVMLQPRGAYIRQQMKNFLRETYFDNDFMPVFSPHIALKEVFDKAGVTAAEGEYFYPVMKVDEDEQYVLRSSLRAFHMLNFDSKQRSYRELPWRISELGEVFNYNKSSDLQGLLNLRETTEDTCHSVCAREQLESELESQFNLSLKILRTFGLNDFEIIPYFLMPTKSKSLGLDLDWEFAASSLRSAIRRAGYSLKEVEIPSDYYGPRIEVVFRDPLKRQRYLSIIQVDIATPKKLELEYMGKDGLPHMPYVIYQTTCGSLEKLIAVLIEQYSGNMPLWLQFEKCRILPVSSANEIYADTVARKFHEAGVYVSVDYSTEPIEGKIKQAEEDKIPYILVVGEKEQKVNGVSVRLQGVGDLGLMMFDNFLVSIQEEIKSKSIKTLIT